MGLLDINKKNKSMHLQVQGNFRDLQRYEEMQRRKRWFIFLDFLIVICLLIGIGMIYFFKNYTAGAVFILIGAFIILYFILRKRARKVRRFAHPTNQRNFRRKNRRFRNRRYRRR